MFRNVTVALMAFLTLVDLFATQAILPTLAQAYRVSPAAMGLAVNASTIGMAIAGLVVALVGRRLDRRVGVAVSLALLALPTAALALAPDLTTFAALRIVQGLAMSTAFALTLSYLAEHCSMRAAAGAFAAYVTGNVASNLFGRLMSASLAEHLGLSGNFVVFAALNLAGGVLAWFTLARHQPMPAAAMPQAAWSTLIGHWRNAALRTSFAIGFLILFAFIGTFTYVNFVLARAPIALSPMALGLVYFVFLPALVTTPLAGRAIQRFGTQRAFRVSLLRGRHRPAVAAVAEPRRGGDRAGSASAPARSSRRPRPPASSAAPPPTIPARPAACTSRATSAAASSAPRWSASCSSTPAGRRRWPRSVSRSRWRHGWRAAW